MRRFHLSPWLCTISCRKGLSSFPDIAYSTERLSPGQKFELAVDNSVSVNTIGSAAFLGSLVGQADDAPTGFGQGWNAYGKRFGADMARSASSEMFATFLLGSALHQDPRFYAEINPRFFHAMKYSLQRVFIMQDDNGRQVVAWSRLLVRRWPRGWRMCTGRSGTERSEIRCFVMVWTWPPEPQEICCASTFRC